MNCRNSCRTSISEALGSLVVRASASRPEGLVPCPNCRGGLAIYRPFGEFRRANSFCHLIYLQFLWFIINPLTPTIVRSVPLEIDESSGHEKVPTRGKPGLERPGRPRGQRIVRQTLVDLTMTRSTIRADVGEAIVPQTISKANLKSKRPFRALPLTPEHRQLRLQ
ncbi:HTH_Tnp_Tc3_2 domain-containing protein [Trichonephila clavipes]|nr:HTH_Tnp_Tc3_2 domain-containing protein [Trichonephila clavipes]